MSKPRYAWYGEIKRRIKEGKWKNPQSFQDYVLMKAIYEAEKETKALPNGEDRLKVIDLCLYKGESVIKAEMKLFFSERTAIRWINSFVNSVGKKAGY